MLSAKNGAIAAMFSPKKLSYTTTVRPGTSGRSPLAVIS
jgi:hypothetical protein